MKKVGIATLHYSDNYGAVLQAWALRKIINEFHDSCAEIINYIPDDYEYLLYVNDEENRNRMIHKRKLFDNFLINECGVKSEEKKSIEDDDYDYICVGSDQVWNMTFVHTRNGEYLLPNVKHAIKFSYAASIGLNVKDADKYCDFFKKYLPQFEYLSLREDEQLNFVKEMSGKSCIRVLDPTLLVDSHEYRKLCSSVDKENGEFIFLFWLPHLGEIDKRKNLELANRLSQKYGYKIIHNIPDVKHYSINKDGGCMCYDGVEDFLWYIDHAKIVVSNSYHATIFSILFNTPFYTTIVKSMESRFNTLSSIFNIEDRIIRNFPQSLSISEEEEPIRKNLFEIEKRKSLEYLKTALQEVKK